MSLDAGRIVTDLSGLTALKAQARANRDDAVGEVAQQFEALFVQMMLQRMRAASFGGGLFDNQQSLFYRDMYDQQLASHLAGQGGIGLADRIKEQLGTTAGVAAAPGRDAARNFQRPEAGADGGKAESPSATAEPAASRPPGRFESPDAFVQRLWPAAARAAEALGIAPEALLAQAALETGWGRHVMPRADGGSSHNLFGIKADRRWEGDRVRKTTLEYKDGVALKTRADFRAYDSYAEAFMDYVDFLRRNPRYRTALQATAEPGDYFRELQAAGYATDPSYAEKITRILDSPQMLTALMPLQTGASRPI